MTKQLKKPSPKNVNPRKPIQGVLGVIRSPETRSRFRAELEARGFWLDNSDHSSALLSATVHACTAVEDWLEERKSGKAVLEQREALKMVRRGLEGALV